MQYSEIYLPTVKNIIDKINHMCTRLLTTELTLSLPSFELKCDGN